MDDAEHIVMIVEDDADARAALADLVSLEGYRTIVAANGREALLELETAKQRALPCLILLDLMMPVLDGWQFLREQEQDPALSSIPVVVLSAHADGKRAAEGARAAGFLPKPIDFDALIRVVRQHC